VLEKEFLEAEEELGGRNRPGWSALRMLSRFIESGGLLEWEGNFGFGCPVLESWLLNEKWPSWLSTWSFEWGCLLCILVVLVVGLSGCCCC
jgi:hypothetical protein